jgi:methionyl-tRNA formyltransferase
MGTPDFAVPSLAALIDAGHDIAAVYSQPPRKAGRGHRDTKSPVHHYADSKGLSVRTPISLKADDDRQAFAALDLDVAVVAAYGLILPQPVLDAPRLGCVNVHASLLPRWRGAAPIERALLAGDTQTGVTIMMMEKGLDTGPTVTSEAVPITGDTTASALHDTLAALGARMIVPALTTIDTGNAVIRPQPAEGATYANKITKQDGLITWQDAETIDRQVRALMPWPGVTFAFRGEAIKVSSVALADTGSDAAPGTVLDDQVTVAFANGAVRLLRLQRPGKTPVAAEAFVRGFPIPAGTVL